MSVSRRALLAGGGALLAAAALPHPAARADGLLGLVEEYARLDHRTGSTRMVDWLCGQLAGARVTRPSYAFERYRWDARLTVDGREVPAIPYYFEGTGDIQTTGPFARSAAAGQVAAALGEADAAGARLAVLSTSTALDSAPDRTVTGIPTLLTPEPVAGRIHARLRASRQRATAQNVAAWFGAESTAPIVISTPLSGWYNCAAQRGHGLAIGLELARRLGAADNAVLFVSSTGHELGGIGLTAYLEQWDAPGFPLRPRAVIALGDCLAAAGPDGKLVATRQATARPAAATNPALADALRAGGFAAGTFTGTEIASWRQYLRPDVPMLAFTGTSPQLRTPADLPGTTTAELLATVQRSVNSAADALLTGRATR